MRSMWNTDGWTGVDADRTDGRGRGPWHPGDGDPRREHRRRGRGHRGAAGPGGPGGPGYGPGEHFGEGFGPGRGRGPRRGPRGYGRGGRARRGDVRNAILSLLAEGPSNGYGLIKSIAERSGGVWTPSPGSVYPTLQQLVDERLVTADDAGEHSLTDAGRNHVEAHAEELAQVWQPLAEMGEQVAFAAAMRKLAGVAKQIGRDGSAEQQQRAAELVDKLRKELYLMLAED